MMARTAACAAFGIALVLVCCPMYAAMRPDMPEARESATAGGVVPQRATSVLGPQPWLFLLCQFSDLPVPRPPEWYRALLLGPYPSLDHYWRDVSYNAMSLAGSRVAGWFTVSQPYAHYVYDHNGDGDADDLGDYEVGAFQKDCLDAADATVNYPDFAGIAVIANGSFPHVGGSGAVTRDGQTRVYGLVSTWSWPPMPANGAPYSINQAVMAHEMGHAFGLPHSGGPYGSPYDSRWDVMSGGETAVPHPDYGYVAVHTISFHKTRLGWIPSAKRYEATPGTDVRLLLDPLSAVGENYLSVEVRAGGLESSVYWTIEARAQTGYDEPVPLEGVVIHRVDERQQDLHLGMAHVLDADGNGDPNDDGAVWTVGESMTDPESGSRVTVESRVGSAYLVHVVVPAGLQPGRRRAVRH